MKDQKIISVGCNTFPKGFPHIQERPAKYSWIEHAERNAIYTAARNGVGLEGSSMYLNWYPCVPCARAIIQSGIVCLYAFEPDWDDPKWEFRLVAEMLDLAAISVSLSDNIKNT